MTGSTPLLEATVPLRNGVGHCSLLLATPKLWSAEAPNLYQLVATRRTEPPSMP